MASLKQSSGFYAQATLLSKYFMLMFLFLGSATQSFAESSPPKFGKISDQTLILIVHSDGNIITINESVQSPLKFNARSHEGDNHHYSLISENGDVLFTSSFPDPLKRWVDDFSDPSNPQGGQVTVPEHEFLLKVPYLTNATSILFEYIDEQGTTIPLGESLLQSSTE